MINYSAVIKRFVGKTLSEKDAAILREVSCVLESGGQPSPQQEFKVQGLLLRNREPTASF